MRRPAGLVSGPSARVGVVQPQPRNLVRATLAPAPGCDCGGARSRRSAQQGDKVSFESCVVAKIRELNIVTPSEGDSETAFAHQEAAAAETSIQGKGEGQDIQEAGSLHGRRQDELLQVGVFRVYTLHLSFFVLSPAMTTVTGRHRRCGRTGPSARAPTATTTRTGARATSTPPTTTSTASTSPA